MPAVVETMFFQGATPWHKEGTKIEDGKNLSTQEGIKAAGLDWRVDLKDLVTCEKAQSAVDYTHGGLQHNEDPPTVQPNVKHKAVIRSTDESVLGVVGPRYNPLQNIEAFEWFQPFLDANLCKLHTAGSLFNGQKVWVLAELNTQQSEIIRGDNIQKFLLLSNSHDGTSAVRVGYSAIRVVCANTLAMAHSSSNSQLLRIKHSRQLHTNLDTIRDIINLADQQFEATAEQYRFLASRHINSTDLKKYVKTLLDIEGKPEEDVSTQSKNTLNKIVHLALNGKGTDIPNVRGTLWAGYNAYTEYLSYEYGRNSSNRLNNLWFGQNHAKNKKALDLAVEIAG